MFRESEDALYLIPGLVSLSDAPIFQVTVQKYAESCKVLADMWNTELVFCE